MSYPNYSYNGFNMPNPNYPQSYPQTFQPLRTQPQMQGQSAFQEVKFVTDAQAEAYMVDPNCKVMLIDKENQIFWIKWADAMGQPYCEKFKYESLNNTNQGKNEPDFSGFVKQKDFEDVLTKINERLNGFEIKLNGKNAPIEPNS